MSMLRLTQLNLRQHCRPARDPLPRWLHRLWGWF